MKESRFLTHPEKRNHRRLDVDLEVGLVIDGKKVDTTASNISCGGLFIAIPKNQFTDNPSPELELMVHLPDTEKPVRVYGEVARIQYGEGWERSPEGVAVKFKGLYDDNILAIDRFIKNKLH